MQKFNYNIVNTNPNYNIPKNDYNVQYYAQAPNRFFNKFNCNIGDKTTNINYNITPSDKIFPNSFQSNFDNYSFYYSQPGVQGIQGILKRDKFDSLESLCNTKTSTSTSINTTPNKISSNLCMSNMKGKIRV